MNILFHVLLLAGTTMARVGPVAPTQPIPFSHKTHMTLGMKCENCHQISEPSNMMVIPQAPKCMSCHRAINTDSPAIKKLREYVQEKHSIPWVKVCELPSFVFFSHKTHLDAHMKCEKCHGPVAENSQMRCGAPLSMVWCMNCHRETSATIDCRSCHELQQ